MIENFARFPCPPCGADVRVAYDEGRRLLVAHGDPMCRMFEDLEPRQYLAEVVRITDDEKLRAFAQAANQEGPQE